MAVASDPPDDKCLSCRGLGVIVGAANAFACSICHGTGSRSHPMPVASDLSEQILIREVPTDTCHFFAFVDRAIHDRESAGDFALMVLERLLRALDKSGLTVAKNSLLANDIGTARRMMAAAKAVKS